MTIPDLTGYGSFQDLTSFNQSPTWEETILQLKFYDHAMKRLILSYYLPFSYLFNTL